MSLSAMKEELHQRLWSAHERWFALRETGETKRDLKLASINEHGDAHYLSRQLVFRGTTRLDYERALKPFIEFCHARGHERNADIGKRDMRGYFDHLIDRRVSASYLDKVRSALVKFMSLYGKYESARAMSHKFGLKIRDLVRAGVLPSAAHQRITSDVADRAIARLRELDGDSRAYHLAAELQRHVGLRALEATERLTPDCLVDAQVVVQGKGGRERRLAVPADLLKRLRGYFHRTGALCLAPLRAYEAAFGRAVLDVGGRATGTHALRRLWAEETKSALYHELLRKGLTPERATDEALAETLERLGHGRDRRELRAAYLRAA